MVQKTVSEEAKERFKQLYPEYKEKIKQHAGQFTGLQNIGVEDVESILLECLLKACEIWDEERAKFKTIFWTIVHNKLKNLQEWDSRDKRSATIIGYNQLKQDYFYDYREYVFESQESMDQPLINILVSDKSKPEALRLTEFQKKLCKEIGRGYPITDLREKYGVWKIKKELRAIKNTLEHMPTMLQRVRELKKEANSPDKIKEKLEKEFSFLCRTEVKRMIHRLKI